MPTPTSLPLAAVRFTGGLLAERIERIGTVTLQRQWEALNDRIPGAPPSHAVRNLRIAAGDETGAFAGLCFQDSDMAKWLEAACYRLTLTSDAKLSAAVDELVDLYERAQAPDGYLHTYHQLQPDIPRWSNLRDMHELYCAGHFIEAAVAHHGATGSPRLLAVATKLTALLARTFGHGQDQIRGYPGHPELELALVRLAHATGDGSALELAHYFVSERGASPAYFTAEASARQEKTPPIYVHGDDLAYWQAHAPVVEHTEPRGHAVRAMYLYAAMADLTRDRGDKALGETCRRLWDDMVARHLYIIGGIGSDGPGGEKFSAPFDLPDDRSYAETCAAIGLVFWARRMLDLELDARYTEVMERALYNNVLAGLSRDGCHYFYVNPLAVTPPETHRRYDCRMVKTQRVPWFGCACCPPNVARLLSSLGQYAVSRTAEGLALHLFADMTIREDAWHVRVTTDYPWTSRVVITVEAAPAETVELAVRASGPVPGAQWALNGAPLTATAEHGYLRLRRRWEEGDTLMADLPLPVQRVRAHPGLTAAAGRIALQRGPLVYAVEEADHGAQLGTLGVRRDAPLEVSFDGDLWDGVMVITGEAQREIAPAGLYDDASPVRQATPLRAIPYAWWGHRGEGEMRIWIRDYET
ncbi:glycoside hydrolase family 127 protein [Synoicihabitans lomoniglobus]|uniref:Glycoside hydrolase family 127 protein n=1 Tax=Synoicihabitans lomoniglobus TaxID=2909285 RepID=A0AAF0CS02_9BACT|nr:glycoside hydrolase family 127 protein [Opitutaceae bacterium LMO-M01]WED66970.1 glycoside hydrolase family 127 protein [Opitutaceae bacterium LMO-M01]